jgi:hypothetical protein
MPFFEKRRITGEGNLGLSVSSLFGWATVMSDLE